MGFTESQAWDTAWANIQAIRNQYSSAGATLREQGEQARRGVTDEHLTRGTYLSGEKLEDLARQRGIEERTLAEMEADFAGQIAGQQTGLNERLTELTRQRSEQVGNLQERTQRREQEAKLTALQTLAALPYESQEAFRRWVGAPSQPAPAAQSPGYVPAAPQSPQEKLNAMSPAEREAFSRFVAPPRPGPAAPARSATRRFF